MSSCSEQQNQTQQKDEMRIMIMLKEPLQIRFSETSTDFVIYPQESWFIKISERPIMQEKY